MHSAPHSTQGLQHNSYVSSSFGRVHGKGGSDMAQQELSGWMPGRYVAVLVCLCLQDSVLYSYLWSITTQGLLWGDRSWTPNISKRVNLFSMVYLTPRFSNLAVSISLSSSPPPHHPELQCWLSCPPTPGSTISTSLEKQRRSAWGGLASGQLCKPAFRNAVSMLEVWAFAQYSIMTISFSEHNRHTDKLWWNFWKRGSLTPVLSHLVNNKGESGGDLPRDQLPDCLQLTGGGGTAL